MSIYVFNLLVGYLPNGVDNAQGYRHRFLKNLGQDIHYIFTDCPLTKPVARYSKTSIPVEKMTSPYHFFCGNRAVHACKSMESILQQMQQDMPDIEILDNNGSKRIIRDGKRISQVIASEEDSQRVSAIDYYKNECLIRTEVYTDGLLFTDHFVTASRNGSLYAKRARRTFFHKNGEVSFEVLFKNDDELFIFPDGSTYTKIQFLKKFIQSLQLTKHDTVIVDRCAMLNFIQPLFESSNQARIVAVLHSEHYFERYQDPSALYLNYELYYLFKYAHKINTFVVSTEEQRRELLKTLQKYGYFIPSVKVIPAGALEMLRYPTAPRRPYSLVTVSRLEEKKKVEWVVRSVIAAHKRNPNISLDVYGTGNIEYIRYLKEIIDQENAQNYIHLLGHVDVSNLYTQYQVYISASLGETFGLSLMEAAGSGNAFIGLDVRYGNRLFIQPNKNGYLIDFSYDLVPDRKNEVIERMTDKIVDIFTDNKVEEFSKKSYEIAQQFLAPNLEKNWKQLF